MAAPMARCEISSSLSFSRISLLAFLGALRVSAVKSLRIQPMQHAREGNRLANGLQPADPGDGALDSPAETGVGDAAGFAGIEIPLESFFRQIVLVNALQEQVVRGHALRSTDDFAVAFGGQHVHA